MTPAPSPSAVPDQALFNLWQDAMAACRQFESELAEGIRPITPMDYRLALKLREIADGLFRRFAEDMETKGVGL